MASVHRLNMNRRYYKIVQSKIIYFFSLWFTVNSSALTPSCRPARLTT